MLKHVGYKRHAIGYGADLNTPSKRRFGAPKLPSLSEVTRATVVTATQVPTIKHEAEIFPLIPCWSKKACPDSRARKSAMEILRAISRR